MAISFSRYVDVTSSVGGAALVNSRDLILRLFTDNLLLPSNGIMDFTSAADVGEYFGTTSQEYYRANFYFSWISKLGNSPEKISFARWVDANQAPMIFGGPVLDTLSQFNAITNGALSLTMGTFTYVITGLDFAAAGSFAAIATIIQTAIQAETGGGALWTSATVTYDSTTHGFNLVGGVAESAVISVQAPGTGTDITQLMGWLPNSPTAAIWSNGSLVQSLTDILTSSTSEDNNFGSFAFIPTLDQAQIVEVATWTDAQNVAFMFLIPVNSSNASAISAAIENYSGCAMTLSPLSNEYPELIPGLIMAATDYTQPNSVQNYMYQTFAVTPSVTSNADANTYDALNVNYYGQTQTAGQYIQFYQRGELTGGINAPLFMNIFANEQWFKDAAAIALANLLLILAKISANPQGRGQILVTLQSVINQALLNGTISVGNALTAQQKLYIQNVTNDPLAWYQVQNSGYWLNVFFTTFIDNGGNTEYQANYIIVYKKDDVVNKIVGTQILI